MCYVLIRDVFDVVEEGSYSARNLFNCDDNSSGVRDYSDGDGDGVEDGSYDGSEVVECNDQ